MKYKLLLVSAILLFYAFSYNGGDDKKVKKNLEDDDSHYTNVGNIGLTVTNFGTYGNGFIYWPDQPSCEYPLGSGIEHIFDGGLWVGGFIANDSLGNGRTGPYVTTGAVDAASVSAKGGGFEYTNTTGSHIVERSSLIESRFYSPDAVSHQDFVMDFVDTNVVYSNGEPIENHDPMGLSIHEEAYAWNFPFANFFVILNFTVKNVTNKYIDSVYVGLWTDAVVRNTKITGRHFDGAFFNKSGDGYSDSLKIAYEFDATGDIGYTDSYVGIQQLGSTPALPKKILVGNDSLPTVNYVSWQFRNAVDPNFFSPIDDIQRYRKMQGYFGGNNRYGSGVNPADLKTPSNRSELITKGPFHKIAPGDSLNVVFAIVCAKKYGNDPAAYDTEEQKTNLYSNADWALRAYFGEDRNRNGILDTGEDLNGDGKITRYVLPSPPVLPHVKVVPGNQKATIYWDKKSESSIDPISAKKDFEGYRIYRTESGFDLSQKQDILSSLVLLAEFDSANNEYSYNTGFSAVKLNDPVTFPNDPTQYYYKYELNNLLNGWQYLFAVTAFDKGDPSNNLESLESSSLSTLNRIIPGTPPSEEPSVQVGVYPNPYYANAVWDGSSERLRKIYFYNLPSECEITVYTLSGDVVKRITHNEQSNGSDLRWFENYSSGGNQKMSGGEHAWDLITNNDQAIATGMYLFTVKNTRNGDIKTGKFLVVK
ncbi:MAG TPA: hypothetical protein VKD08_06805 [Ignavibacteriaceae bacterium]|nr:hypothetical protein [Ignavibacteriaceae bacterium]